MRISDWSSDVCSSDLPAAPALVHHRLPRARGHQLAGPDPGVGAARRERRRAGAVAARDRRHGDEGAARAAARSGMAQLRTHHCRDADQLPALARRRGQPVKIGRHTSELQSLMRISYAVFCLKKKNKKKRIPKLRLEYNKYS